MAWKMRYRCRVETAGVGTQLVAINGDYARDLGYTQVLGLLQSFVRRFQSAGIDARGDMYGKPVGTNATDTANPLSTAHQAEQLYAALDTPDYGLRRGIALANSTPSGANDDVDDSPSEAAGNEA